MRFFQRPANDAHGDITADPRIVLEASAVSGAVTADNAVQHKFGVVPFIEFANNRERTSDLPKYKELIDIYDKVVSGFGNDLEDIQEVIFVIKNFGGERLAEILQNLKLFKAVKVAEDDSGRQGGLDTLTIDIPVEARRVALDILRRQIFVSGQGVDPDPQSFGSASGVALKFLYSLLEMKVGLMETEFRSGFADLIRAILSYHGMGLPAKIVQTFNRSEINNELENAQVTQMLAGILSEYTLLQNNYWVDSVDNEMERLEKEREAQALPDVYHMTGKLPPPEEVEDDGEEEQG